MFKRLFFKLLPVQILILAMGSINSIVDGAVAGRFIDAESVGVIGLYFTMVNVLAAVGSVLLGGSSILCGRYMGRGDIEKTDSLFSLNLTLATIVGVILSAVSLLIPGPLANALGASPELKNALVSYIRGYGFGIVPLLLAQQTAMFLQLERKSRLGYIGVAAMIVSNIVLDIVLVEFLDMGTFGLALSTSISNWIYFLILVSYYFTGKAQLSFSLSKIDITQIWPLLKTGFPGAALIFYLAVRALALNLILLKHAGSDGLSAQGAFGMFSGLEVAFCVGVGAVVRMMSSVQIGEENRDGLRAIMKTALTKGMLLSVVVAVITALLSGVFASLFFADRASHVYELTRQLFLIYALCMPLIMAIQIFCNYLQASGHIFFVNLMSFFDGFLAVVGPALILAPMLGAFGVWLSHPTGLCFILVTVFIYACIFNRHFPSSLDDWLFLKKSFGVSDDRRLELVVESMDAALSTSKQVYDFCTGHSLSHKTCVYAALSIEEMVGNIIRHGFSADRKKHQVIVSVILKNDGLLLRIKDDCIPFDPKERASQLSSERPEKNIGIRMVMKLADDIIYQNNLGLNVLTIRFPAI